MTKSGANHKRKKTIGSVAVSLARSFHTRWTKLAITSVALVSLIIPIGASYGNGSRNAVDALSTSSTSITNRVVLDDAWPTVSRSEQRDSLNDKASTRTAKTVVTSSDGSWSMGDDDMGATFVKNANDQTAKIEAQKKAAADKAAAKAEADRKAKEAVKAANKAMTAQSSSASATPVVIPDLDGEAAAAAAYAKSQLDDGQYSCLVQIITMESGWRVNATNTSSGAYGLGQSLPGNKMASAGADWQTSGTTQMKWVLGYIAGRYGKPCQALSFHKSTGWY